MKALLSGGTFCFLLSKEIGLEATEVFRALDQGETVDSVKNLLVAPHCLQNRLLNRIDGEIKAAARGEGGYIGIKINSLTDKVLINIFVCWYDAIHQSRWSKEILYALCIPGAVVAMLSPSWQRLPVWNLLHLHSYSIHVLLILYPVLLLAGGFRPQVHHIRWVLAFLCAIATPIFFLNRLLKTNFFFLNDPQGNAITAFFAHCFGERFYLLGFLPVLAAVLLLLYLPWYRAERHQRMLCARDQVIA